MTKTDRSQAGFTLIELMIVIAIIGILAAVAIPNFLRARNQSMYTACLETLSAIKVAEEMYIIDDPGQDGTYSTTPAELTVYMTTTCKDPAGAAAGCIDSSTSENLVEQRLARNCDGGALGYVPNITLNSAGSPVVWGVARDRDQCAICVGQSGYLPTTYSGCEAVKLGAHDGNCAEL